MPKRAAEPFADAEEIASYAKEAADTLRGWGILRGDEAGRFRPADETTRAELAKILVTINEMTRDGGPDDRDLLADFPQGEKLALFLRQSLRDTFPKEKASLIQWISATPVKVFQDRGQVIVLANIFYKNYEFTDGVFHNTSGGAMPLEIHFVPEGDTFAIRDMIESENGDKFSDSVRKMARGDEKVYEALLESQDPKIDEETEKAIFIETLEAAGLKDYCRKLEELPGYDADKILILKDVKDTPAGSLVLVDKAEYEKEKARTEKDWRYVKGILYDPGAEWAFDYTYDDFRE